MNHDRPVLFAVVTDVGQVELLWHHEVQLNSGQGLIIAQGRLRLDIQLRTVESCFALSLVVIQAQVIHGALQHCLGLIPHGIVIEVLGGVLRIPIAQAEAVVGDIEVRIDIHH